jgi:hypothetical protein
MHAVLYDSDLLLHLEDGVEVDVLMTACNDLAADFDRERRTMRALAELSLAPTRSPEGSVEIYLSGEHAELAVRAMTRFAERLDELPPGIPRAVMERALSLRSELAPFVLR